jgi:hypothetical protein
MLKQLIIVTDESLDNQESPFGHAFGFWAAYKYIPQNDKHKTNIKIDEETRYEAAILMDSSCINPLRMGFIYHDSAAVVMICLNSIAQSLESCYLVSKKIGINKVVICSDCQSAIDLITGGKKPSKENVKDICARISKIASEYSKSSIELKARYTSQSNFPLFQKVDKAVKNLRKNKNGLSELIKE